MTKAKERDDRQKKGGDKTGLFTRQRHGFWKDEIEGFCIEQMSDYLRKGKKIPQAQQIVEMFRDQKIFFDGDGKERECPLKSKTILNHLRYREWKALVLTEDAKTDFEPPL